MDRERIKEERLRLYHRHVLDLRGIRLSKYINRGKFIYDVVPPQKPKYHNKANLLGIPTKYLGPSLKVISLLFMVSVTWIGLSSLGSTISYYNDNEGTDNIFMAGLVDFTLGANPFNKKLSIFDFKNNTTTIWGVDVIPNRSGNPFYYYASSTNFSGDLDFCNAVDTTAFLEGEVIYTGPLVQLLSDTTTIINEWTFEFNMDAETEHGICYFDVDFNGWQTRHDLPPMGGFNDTETITAKIETMAQCNALSLGYWKGNDGCSNGGGSSIWGADINNLSSKYSGIFSDNTEEQICFDLWVSNCEPGYTIEGALCRAKAHTLAVELNIVSRHINLDALIAGASNNDSAFPNLGLTSFSTVDESINIIESVMARSSTTRQELRDVAYVASQIYDFYESEVPKRRKPRNPKTPECIFDPSYISEHVDFQKNIDALNYDSIDTTSDTATSTNADNNVYQYKTGIEADNATSSTDIINIASGDSSNESSTHATSTNNADNTSTTTDTYIEDGAIEETATTTTDTPENKNAISSLPAGITTKVLDEPILQPVELTTPTTTIRDPISIPELLSTDTSPELEQDTSPEIALNEEKDVEITEEDALTDPTTKEPQPESVGKLVE